MVSDGYNWVLVGIDTGEVHEGFDPQSLVTFRGIGPELVNNK